MSQDKDSRTKRNAVPSIDDRPNKKMCSCNPPVCENQIEGALTNNDLLHHIVAFFVAEESGLVDGQSLRSGSLVNKRWNEVINSRSLWGAHSPTSRIPSIASSNEVINSRSLWGAHSPTSRIPSIASSLAIRETTDEISSVESLIGFLKLEQVTRSSTEHSFRVLERATGQRCVLSIPKDEQKTPEMLKELLLAHHIQREAFLKPLDADDGSNKHHRFPRGVYVRNRRLVRWYDDIGDDASSSKSLSQPPLLLSPFREKSRLDGIGQSPVRVEKAELDHLLDLERSAGPLDLTRTHVRMDCWATLVDWIVEIVECFDLDDRTAYRAMAFLDRFVSTSKVSFMN
jgi:hypothetical protein